MKKLLAAMLCGALATGTLAGCGNKAEEKKTEAKDDTLKVALCVTGAVNDMGWCSIRRSETGGRRTGM